MKIVIALFCGIIFGMGLALSGMTDRMKVLNFLDILGAWDISLMFVMGSALLVTIPGFYLSRRKVAPLFSDRFSEPTGSVIDFKLVLGATCFGLGWGLYGLCPGPAISSLSYGRLDSLLFLVTMLGGMALENLLSHRADENN